MKSNLEKFISFCVIIAGFIWMILGALLIQNTVHVFRDYTRVELAQQHYYDYSEAARLLRLGCDTLTEQARLYAVTFDLRYLLGYFREKNTDRHREQAINILGEIPESTETKRLIIQAVSASRSLEYTEYRSMNLIISANGYDRTILPKEIEKQLSANPLSEEDRNLPKEEQLLLARRILASSDYQTQKKNIWGNVELHMSKMLEDSKQQYITTSTSVARRYLLQIIYLFVQTLILLFILFYAFIINRQRLKYSKKLEEANIHLNHESRLRHSINQELEKANKELERANKELEEEAELKINQARLESELKGKQEELEKRNLFFAALSHDMRNPLQTIIGYTDLLQGGNNPPEVLKEYLGNVANSADILLALINDILDFFKLEIGEIQLAPDFHDFSEIVLTVVQQFKPKADAKNLRLISNLDKMPDLYFDQHQVRRILYNLVSNAVKFTSDGDVTISATCRNGEDGKKILQFSVEDTGVGIAEEDQAVIFEPYKQGANQMGAKGAKGTGLGLPICKMLLDKMNGTITVTSVPEEGSKFTVIMNAVKFREHKADHDDSVSSMRLNTSVKELSLLLVDDEPFNLKLLKLFCEKLGIKSIRTAKDGKTALDLLRNEGKPDIVMTDIQMPVMDGLKLVAEIRNDMTLSELPVYAITGDIEIIKTYQQDGFTGLLIKPYDITKLTEFFNGIQLLSEKDKTT